jgi:hypothetical protein
VGASPPPTASELGADASTDRLRVVPKFLPERVDLPPLLRGHHAVLGLYFARSRPLTLLDLLENKDGGVELGLLPRLRGHKGADLFARDDIGQGVQSPGLLV